MTHTPVFRGSANGGTQDIYRFPNNYGASVVKHYFSYGLELAVIEFLSSDPEDFNLVYDTPVTDDVIGHLDAETLESLLDSISILAPRSKSAQDGIEEVKSTITT